MIATVTPAPSEDPNTAARSMTPSGLSRSSPARASGRNASLQAGRTGSLTDVTIAWPSATEPSTAAEVGGERVEPVDGEVDVIRVGGPESTDPVGQAPQRIVVVEPIG